MILNLNVINILMGRVESTKIKKITDAILDCKPPGGFSVVEVHKALTKPMTNPELSKASGLSTPTVSLVIKFMRHYGDVTTSKRVNTPTGNTKLFDEYKLKVRPSSNTGVTGVTFVAANKTYHVCYGRKISLCFNNLFDAVCKRKSLELAA